MFKCLLPERASQMGSPFLLVETKFLKNVNKIMNVQQSLLSLHYQIKTKGI